MDKASFLEEWLKVLCASLKEPEAEHNSTMNQKKEVILKAIKSLIEVFEGRNYHAIAQRFDKLANSMHCQMFILRVNTAQYTIEDLSSRCGD
ncbi:unnamed protein product [Ilex paraguariensis]|uniref:Uncharacterized protein n=1 Tax=Ilex paraguariensis TaxID=185542 RepID=A0ABC8S409_9AQUA